MKNKVLRVLLIGLVLTVWGAVVKRAFVRPSPPAVAGPLTGPSTIKPVAKNSVAPRYTLVRDPFLDSAPVNTARAIGERHSHSSPPVQAIPTTPVAPSLAWPSITINGILRDTNGPHYIATATINGKGHVLRAGQLAGPVLVQAITRDSVRFEWSGNQRAFPSAVSW